MKSAESISNPDKFVESLFQIMKDIHPGVGDLELYEFKYGLDTVFPDRNWEEVYLLEPGEIEQQVNSESYYDKIQIKPKSGNKIKLEDEITRLTQMLFVGLVAGKYPLDWVKKHFYFDLRGFYFLHRTQYFTAKGIAHLGGKPFASFEREQKKFDSQQGVGYKEFKTANWEVDGLLMNCVKQLIATKGTPVVIGIAGPTAAGKTEIVERLREELVKDGRKVTSIEMDNFLTARDHREENGIHSLGKGALHLELFLQSLEDITQGKKITIPRYDFIDGNSSHDLDGSLKPGCTPIEIEPADIIFIEGNFPFLIEEVVHLIGIKVVYLTDDAVRLQRKWKRDIDYRKKYDPNYFRNRFFKDQFPMAMKCYIPQMEACDILVDTTGAAVWTTPETARVLNDPNLRVNRVSIDGKNGKIEHGSGTL
jgi:uridine kinase